MMRTKKPVAVLMLLILSCAGCQTIGWDSHKNMEKTHPTFRLLKIDNSPALKGRFEYITADEYGIDDESFVKYVLEEIAGTGYVRVYWERVEKLKYPKGRIVAAWVSYPKES